MRRCSKCRKKKHYSRFSYKNKAKKLRSGICKNCHRLYVNQHYQDNKVSYGKRSKINRKAIKNRNSALIRSLKKKPCYDCGGKYSYYVMDFDHLEPKTKLCNVGRMAGQSISQKRILAEVAKCELVCANCHREREHRRRKRK
jgi:hypothetical protein